MQVRIEHKSIIGSREEQQDSYYVSTCGDIVFAIVCDGMGGTDGGSAASRTAVNKLKELIKAKNPVEPLPLFFLRAIDILDESVVGLKKQFGAEDFGTTIVAVAVENGFLYWLAVGDSRLYIIRGNEIVQITRDHNFALSLEQWTAEELQTAKSLIRNPRADALISFIGIGGIKIYDINETALSLFAGDKVLLTTDGLTKVLANNEILHLLTDNQLSNSLDLLFEKAFVRSNGVQDNTTCVLIQIEDGGTQNG